MTGTLRLGSSPDELQLAADLLRRGELVAIPTETVYGLAARADDADAIRRLFAAKGRPADNPLIVHVADVDAVTSVAADVTPLARQLLTAFAPGPLTVVLTARADLPRIVTGGLATVGVRIPDHPIALALLRHCGLPLAAPSANRSSRPSPTSAEHVLDDLRGRIAAVVDGGDARVGLESTVVDARGDVPVILREGAVTREMLADALGTAGSGTAAGATAADARAPGTRHPHYAPSLPVHVAPAGSFGARLSLLVADGLRVGIVAAPASVGAALAQHGSTVEVLAAPDGPTALAAGLFAALRRGEQAAIDVILLEGVPEVGIGRAVMDRARRAASASGGGGGSGG